jgi:probable F420-dependent oxidoreductase
MKFGLAFSNIEPFAGPVQATRLAQAAEAAGFESVWTVDHVVIPAEYRSRYPYSPSGRLGPDDTNFPDPLIWLSYISAATSTLRLGTAILILPQRNPVVLAKELATLDYLSGGRMILGVGVGWLKEEYEALGVPWDGRGKRGEESIGAMRALWSQPRASYDGVTTNFDDCYLRPQPPLGTIPIHIGGHSPIAARRAGRIGDGFFPFGVGRDEVPALLETVHQSALDAGRDPSCLEVTMDSFVAGGEEALADVKTLQSLGASRVLIPAGMFGSDPTAALQRYANDVMARV